MFRILENSDGTTSIFCKNSGNLVCTIPTKGNLCSHRPVNVVEPQLANEAPSSDNWPQLKRRSSTESLLDENDENSPLTSVRLCSLPLPKDEDYRLEGATQDQFAKCLGLVSTEKLRTHPVKELLAEWPLRLLGKSTAFRASEPLPLKEGKVVEQLPLTSYLGVRLLRLNMPRNFASPERVAQSLRSYESYCRHPYNSTNPNSCHFPKLRCRREKAFSIITPSRVMRHYQTAHVYTRGRRQREEKKKTLRTGLNARSRRLLRQCNAKRCTVDLVRLPQHEIDDWLSRVTTIQIDDSEDSDSEPECYVPRPRLPPRRGRTCHVRVRNILMDIQRRDGTHYVKNTHIKVPYYRDFLSSLRTNRQLLNTVYVANGVVINTKPQQSLLKSRLTPKPPPNATKQRLPVQVPKLEPPPVAVLNELIPVIDLTEEITPPKQAPPPTNGRPIVSGQKVIVSSGRHKLGSNQVLLNVQIGKPNGCRYEPGVSNPSPSVVNGRNLVPNNHFVIVNSGRPGPSGARVPSILNRRGRQPTANGLRPTDEGQVVVNRRGRVPAASQVVVGRPLVPQMGSSVVTQYKFHCFACGLQRIYLEQANSQAVEKTVREHMNTYHATTNAESFLSRYLDSVNRCAVIEAFPGFKDD